jgi:5'-nucleotidase
MPRGVTPRWWGNFRFRDRRTDEHDVTATPTVLVTNDDGIDSPGLVALARCAVDLGWRPVVAAPATESSGSGAGLTASTDHRRIVIERRDLPGLPEVPAHAVAAHPGLIAMIACNGGFGITPDLVLSGINLGANIGRAILHSGTVGAALTAGINDTPAVAVSLDLGPADDSEPRWDHAVENLTPVLGSVAPIGTTTVLSINVPNLPAGQVRPPRWARLASFGHARSRFNQVEDGFIEVATVTVEGGLEPGTDAALLADGHITVTPLRSITEHPELMNGRLPTTT